MTTQETANKWHEFCQNGKNLECIEELYSDDIVSTEMPGMPEQIVRGKQNILKKNKDWFDSIVEWHSKSVAAPIIAGDHFTSKFSFDVTFKERGKTAVEELGVYQVKDGKIIKEQFFYYMG
ncbi:MAG: nuclear transport factor 2 family protein [Bacteroidota bacterium]